MPLHIPKIAQAGYWFHPPITVPEEAPVELAAEAKIHEVCKALRRQQCPISKSLSNSGYFRADTSVGLSMARI